MTQMTEEEMLASNKAMSRHPEWVATWNAAHRYLQAEQVRQCGWEPTPEDGRFWREPVSVTPKYQHLARTTYIGHVWSGESR